MGLKGELAVKRGFCSVEWKIKDFFSTPSHVDDCWSSPSFRLSNASWRLDLYPNGETENESVGFIGLYLTKLEPETEIHEVSCVLGLKATDGTEINCIKFTCIFESSIAYGRPKFYELKELQCEKGKLFSDGTVTFFCQACIGKENTVDADSQTDIRVCYARLTRDLKDLFQREEGADVTIKVKDKEFRVHSNILSARSSVFAPMFRHDTKERNTGVVEIPDYEPDVFKKFLIFLYSGEVEKLSSDNDIGLYSAADKYNIEELKAICSDFMKENITADSFCDVLSLAIRHCDSDLIECLTDYFIKNANKIIVTSKWIEVVKEHPIESNELFKKLTRHFQAE